MKEHRPNPEKLLKSAQDEELRAVKGKLKIYLGAAPGVGKTYTMLQDAIAKRAQGLDVVVGVAESHSRKEIDSLLKGLEILPSQIVEYHGKKLKEFDLDAALARNPGLILVDEMAHTNAPGLRHAKRWQDIKELLDRGVDVYTTLNIQHVESLNDIIAQIIHTRVKETVPDIMLEMADTIELVDLPPEELLKRLQEGKVYFPQQAEIAVENFFRKGNLIALREIALRTTAERVGAQVLLYRQGLGIQHIWPTQEKLLVCIGSRPGSTKIIRAARRMATSLQADWIGVHVETPRLQQSEEEREQAIENLRFAEKLGAETKILSGTDIVKEIIEFAREQNVTKIVIGKRIRSQWKSLFSASLSDELIRESGEIDVYIITGDTESYKPVKHISEKRTASWKHYLAAIASVGIATLIDFILDPYLETSNLIMIYLLAVTTVALQGKLGPSIVVSVLSVLAYDFFFIPPYLSFGIEDWQYLLTLLVMLVITQLITHLAILTHRQAEAAKLSERHTAALHTLSRQLASTRGVDKLLEIAVHYLSDIFNSEVLALLPEENHLVIRALNKAEQPLNDKEQGVAQWVYDLGQPAGLGTDTLPFSDAIYVPLLASKSTIGVLRIRPLQTNHLFTPEQMHLLEACANQIAMAIEVDHMQEHAKKTEFLSESTRANNALLQSVSHDLRTPLAAVMGAATTLTEMASSLEAKKIKKLGQEIYMESEQMTRLINNLLQITYFEAETMKLQIIPHAINDPIQGAVKTTVERLGKKQINIHIPTNLPKVPFDNTLIQEVFVNLLENAIKFTEPDSPIDITVMLKPSEILVCVEDRGPGIVPDEINKLFEKFYRGRGLQSERGLGLGLAICRSIIQAHGGRIWAENRENGGARFVFTLPLRQ